MFCQYHIIILLLSKPIYFFRPKLPPRLQANKSLVLKAVAEAQKSVSANPPKFLETEKKTELFTRKYRENKPNKTEILAVPMPKIQVRTVECVETVKPEVDSTLEEEEEEENVSMKDSQTEEQMDVHCGTPERAIETRFIVTLDGVPSPWGKKFAKDLEGEDMDFSDTKDMGFSKSDLKSRLSRRRSTGKNCYRI